jgi:hypothetical protein
MAAFLNGVPRSCVIASKKTVERRRTPVAAIAAKVRADGDAD